MEGMSATQRSAPVRALDWRLVTGKLRFTIQASGGNVRFGSKAAIRLSPATGLRRGGKGAGLNDRL
jgi:hypothetical protein